MYANSAVPLLLLSLTGAVIAASIKGGINGTKGGGWTPPKDWDWSVTPGRLIPVSEATDDLPTPGYRMSQLQQRIPPHHGQQPFPIMNVAVANNESSKEEKVILIGQNKPSTDSNETPFVSNDLTTSQQQETTENVEQSIPKDRKPQKSLEEQELILLQDEPVVYQEQPVSFNLPTTTEKRDKIPVVEEPMVKVELPEICSITGIGCRDPEPIPQQTDSAHSSAIEQNPELPQQSETVPHSSISQEVVTTTAKSDVQATEILSTIIPISNEEHTTQLDQSPSDSYQNDQLVIQHKLPEEVHPGNSNASHRNNKNSENESTALFSGNITQELVTMFVPDFNISVPTVVHSVISTIGEYMGSNDTTKQDSENSTKNDSDVLISNSQQTLLEMDTLQQQKQEQQEIQQIKLAHADQVPQEVREHIVDEQKLLQIANSWSSTSDSNSTEIKAERRIDEEGNEEKQEQAVVEEVKSEETVKEETGNEGQQHHEVLPATQHPTNATEPPSIGDKIESYWKAATSYVSKALHL